MKLDTDTLKRMALVGAKQRLVELDEERSQLSELIGLLRQRDDTSVKNTKKAKRGNARWTDTYKKEAVTEAKERGIAVAACRLNIKPATLGYWVKKAAK